MKKVTRLILLFGFVLMMLNIPTTAFAAWSFDLENGNISNLSGVDYYLIDIVYNSDDEALSNFELSVGYNDLNLNFAGAQGFTYTKPLPPFGEETVWEGLPFPYTHDPDANVISSITGKIPIGYPDLFFPSDDQKLMVTIAFTILDLDTFAPSFSDVYFVDDTLVVESVFTESGVYSFATAPNMNITNFGQSVSAVPVPSSIFLLGGGLCALLGLTRRKS